jgi:peptidoglycan/LPS O-acetylase OafA/YrhL
MIMLSDISEGRDNNLNLIRFIAAGAVLVSHATPITRGSAVPEPLMALTGHSLGTIAVFIFFAISGFLITASFQRSSSHTSFLLARSLRLMPGLVVSLLLVAFVLGPWVTSLTAAAYFTDGGPYAFVLRNTALFPLQYTLPGVFNGQPVEAVVGSIWTLKHEVLCYLGVFIAGLMGAWCSLGRAALALGLYACIWGAGLMMGDALPYLAGKFLTLSLPFVIGIAFWIWRERLVMHPVICVVLVAVAWAVRGTPLALPGFALALSYVTFWLAYVPGGAVRAFNRLGDYSYGVYVYAFPVQGLAVHLVGAQTPLQNMALAAVPTLVLAIASWHLIEGPAMGSKSVILRLLGRGRSQRVGPKG